MGAKSWIRIPRPIARARARLVCLPHAGAGASIYFPWAPILEARGVELRAVQLPGREDRIAEDLIESSAELIDRLVEAWPEISGGEPCALFGHSMGALLTFELARELWRRGQGVRVTRLFLSGRNPPHAAAQHEPLHHLRGAEFMREFTARYRTGFPPEVLADPELLELLAPIFRADSQVLNGHQCAAGAPVDVSFTVYGGLLDPWTTPGALAEWQSYSSRPTTLEFFPGDHYFHQSERVRVVESICRQIAA
jgi:medium-chain acyl-[acyl-carrier-protein] hydrolase